MLFHCCQHIRWMYVASGATRLDDFTKVSPRRCDIRRVVPPLCRIGQGVDSNRAVATHLTNHGPQSKPAHHSRRKERGPCTLYVVSARGKSSRTLHTFSRQWLSTRASSAVCDRSNLWLPLRHCELPNQRTETVWVPAVMMQEM